MASLIKNPQGQIVKLPRGRPSNLGTIAIVNDVVAFTVQMDTFYSQGVIVIQVANGIVGGTFKLEASIDSGTSWFDVPMSAAITTADFGDTAASTAFTVTVSGYGSGAQFRFGLSAVTSGSAAVWALVG